MGDIYDNKSMERGIPGRPAPAPAGPVVLSGHPAPLNAEGQSPMTSLSSFAAGHAEYTGQQAHRAPRITPAAPPAPPGLGPGTEFAAPQGGGQQQNGGQHMPRLPSGGGEPADAGEAAGAEAGAEGAAVGGAEGGAEIGLLGALL